MALWRVEATVLIHEISATAVQIATARHWGGELAFGADAQWSLLRAIDRMAGCPSISDLARLLRISRQGARGLVLNAARAGLVELLTHPDDRRIIQVELTPTARARLNAARQRESAWVVELLNGLQLREMRRLAHVLWVIRRRLARNEREQAD